MPQESGSFTRLKIGIVILVVLCLFFFAGGSSDVTHTQTTHGDISIVEELSNVRVLNASHHGDFAPQLGRWVNITGFTNETDFAWEDLGRAQTLAHSHRTYALGRETNATDNAPAPAPSFYSSVSGSVHGHWTVSSRHRSPFMLQTASPQGNLTGPGGWVSVSIDEYEIDEPNTTTSGTTENGELSWIRGTFAFDDPNGKNTIWKTRLNGVHVRADGSIILVSTSNKLAGIFALPLLVPGRPEFESVKQFIIRQVNDTIAAQTRSREKIINPWSSHLRPGDETNQDDLFPQCDLVIYLQQHAPYEGNMPKIPLSMIEAELREPTGLVPAQARDMVFSMVAFSPDCGYVIESNGPPIGVLPEENHLHGPKSAIEMIRTRNHVLGFLAILLCQLRLLMLQMAEATTPSVLSRLSAPTFVLLFLGDNGCSMMLGTYSLVYPGLGTTFLAALFISFLCSTFFDLRLILNILAAQASASRPREADTAAASVSSEAPDATTPADRQGQPIEPDTLPLPAITRRGDGDASVVVLPTGQDGPAATTVAGTTLTRETSGGPIYAVLLGISFVLMVGTASALSWRDSFQRIYFFFLAFGLMSIWTPQIYRNAVRNCRKALRWDFVLGQSILRLLPLAYFYVYPYSIVWTRQHWWTMYTMAAWVWVQVIVLASQNLFGARWFLNDNWLPPAYDYHPILVEDAESDSEGAGLPIGDKSDGTGSIPGIKVYECVICMQDVEVRTVRREESTEGGSLAKMTETMLARTAYMVTPCRHIFHSACLEAWLRLRLQCPMCREPVPAV